MYEIIPMLIVDSIILGISSYQDIKYKSVDDIIIYSLFIFNIFYFLFLIYLGYYPQNILFSYFILLLFIILYSLRLLAIGDLYVFFSIFLLLSYFSLNSLFLFFFYLFLFGFIFHNLEGAKIFYKNNNKYFYLSILDIIIILLSIYFIYNFFFSYSILYLFISLIFLYISYFIFRIFEKELREKLTFRRKAEELVEGDWIEDNIELEKIEEEDMNLLLKYFDVERKEKYILRFKKEKIYNKILLIIISILPIIFYIISLKFFIFSIIIILLSFHIFQNKIFKGRKGLSKEEIEVLKKVSKYNKIEFNVYEGAPFVPPIFFALILLII
ncbi:MAG: hypothetical protein ACP5GJ_03675 [Nanopusillaceae archaeon]